MKQSTWIRRLFLVAGVYEAVLGIVFLAAAPAIYTYAGVEPPNHLAYVQFPALLLILFGVMFFRIASNPAANSNLIPYGVGLKVAYCSVYFCYALISQVPRMWAPWAWIDLIFLLLFLAALRNLRQERVAAA